VDFLVALVALDAYGKGVGAVTMPAGARTRLSPAVLSVDCGVIGS